MSKNTVFKSGTTSFQNLTSGNSPYNPFGRNADPSLAQVPVALAGSTNQGMLFWQIGGGGMNGIAADYCQQLGVLDEANRQLAQAAQSFGAQTATNVSGRITSLHLSDDAQVQNLFYTASPDLNNMSEEEAKKAMQKFGREFRRSLAEQGQSEVVMPLFSGGIYSGGHDKEKIAKWTMQGFFAEEEKSNLPPMENVYFAAPQFTTEVLQEAQRNRAEALQTKTRNEQQTQSQPRAQQNESSPNNSRQAVANLMTAAGCKEISIVTSPYGNPQAKFSFNSQEEMAETLKKLRSNEKLKNPRAAGEPWQIKQDKDGKWNITLRSSETYLLGGFGRGDQEKFKAQMTDASRNLSLEKENENTAKTARQEAKKIANLLQESGLINSGAGESEASTFLSGVPQSNSNNRRAR